MTPRAILYLILFSLFHLAIGFAVNLVLWLIILGRINYWAAATGSAIGQIIAWAIVFIAQRRRRRPPRSRMLRATYRPSTPTPFRFVSPT